MSQAAISIDDVSKFYRLGLIGGSTLHADVSRWWARVWRKPDPLLRIGETDHGNRESGVLWALRNVSIDVSQGEVLGIIGGNGAGKSTLLKVLSRVTAPTEGEVRIRGSVASLLEVGTGFHPELTGRENIFLNGAILGMSRARTRRTMDEIVDFAEVGEFLDTPVKRYSSGMYVRLAFAVAAHLDPDILIVDEVLAVGDLAFQDKCLRKMKDVSDSARTVLFVSHNMGAVQRLCTRTVVLERGRAIFAGDTHAAISEYRERSMPRGEATSGRFERDLTSDPPRRQTWVQAIELHDARGRRKTRFSYGEPLRLAFELEGKAARPGMSFVWTLLDSLGMPIAHSNSAPLCGYAGQSGQMKAVCAIRRLPLAVGDYFFTVSAGIPGSSEPKDIWRDAARFSVIHCDPFDVKNEHVGRGLGPVVLEHAWIDDE
jgi:lipopolysaccharide transport system ATP-binding protein